MPSVRTRLCPRSDADLIARIQETYEGWGARWREFNKQEEDRMEKHLTVSFHRELAPTDENIALAKALFENQTGTEGEEAVFVWPPKNRVWGFVSASASLLFVEPR